MNTQPIESARDSDLRLSQAALQRAALRAWELAVQTGTSIVVVQHGELKQINPAAQDARPTVQAPLSSPSTCATSVALSCFSAPPKLETTTAKIGRSPLLGER